MQDEGGSPLYAPGRTPTQEGRGGGAGETRGVRDALVLTTRHIMLVMLVGIAPPPPSPAFLAGADACGR